MLSRLLRLCLLYFAPGTAMHQRSQTQLCSLACELLLLRACESVDLPCSCHVCAHTLRLVCCSVSYKSLASINKVIKVTQKRGQKYHALHQHVLARSASSPILTLNWLNIRNMMIYPGYHTKQAELLLWKYCMLSQKKARTHTVSTCLTHPNNRHACSSHSACCRHWSCWHTIWQEL